MVLYRPGRCGGGIHNTVRMIAAKPFVVNFNKSRLIFISYRR